MNVSKFDNYISEFISTEELKELLENLKTLQPGDPKLIFKVNDSGDGMVTGDAETWLQVSESNHDKLCYMLKDDDGDSELNTYDMTVPGLADCLDSLSSQQEEVDYKSFYEAVHQLLKEFKK